MMSLNSEPIPTDKGRERSKKQIPIPWPGVLRRVLLAAGVLAAAFSSQARAKTSHIPVAKSDVVSTAYGTPIAIDVLANDSDPDGDPLSLSIMAPPDSGRAEVSGSQVIYTPADKFVGVDLFYYQISDGHGGTAIAAVSVMVRPPPSSVVMGQVAVSGTPVPDCGRPAKRHPSRGGLSGFRTASARRAHCV